MNIGDGISHGAEFLDPTANDGKLPFTEVVEWIGVVPVLCDRIGVEGFLVISHDEVGIGLCKPVQRFVLVYANCPVECLDGLIRISVPYFTNAKVVPSVGIHRGLIKGGPELFHSFRIKSSSEKSDSLMVERIGCVPGVGERASALLPHV